MKRILLIIIVLPFLLSTCQSPQPEYTGKEYNELKEKIASGWNTWYNHSVTSHVKLPEKVALNIYALDRKSGRLLDKTFIGNKIENSEVAIPGDHAYDGSYTDLSVSFENLSFRIETASDGDNISILITPDPEAENDGQIILFPSILWEADGEITRQDDHFIARVPEGNIEIYTGDQKMEPGTDIEGEACFFSLDKPIGISTGEQLTVEEIKDRIDRAAKAHTERTEAFGEMADIYQATQTVISWNTIYDPTKDRVITPVSRIWNYGWNGYVLFCWDNYFVSYMFSMDNKELAFANAIEITHEITETGFVPNFAATHDLKSRDRSQPPVGSMMVKEIYKKYPEKWFLHEVFDELLTWNRWWPDNRDTDGLLCWGSNPYPEKFGDRREKVQNVLQGAKFESGLDNSPMFDDATFDTVTHQMRLAVAGLTGLYIADCRALAEIATVIGKQEEADELTARADYYAENIQRLWNEEKGIFLNMHTDSKNFSNRISPTNFYPLIGRAATQQQAERMMADHFYSIDEFWGDWIMPSIARNDPGYPDNSYWRGRIWAPMNFLVYLGLKNYNLPEAQRDLADKSAKLLLNEWNANRFIHENYNAETGEGADVRNSDNFYHWGALLGIVKMIESGILPDPGEPVPNVKD